MENQIIMEQTTKLGFSDEESAEEFVNQAKAKADADGNLIMDYKISVKETKSGSYVILTIKERMKTLNETKELLGV